SQDPSTYQPLPETPSAGAIGQEDAPQPSVEQRGHDQARLHAEQRQANETGYPGSCNAPERIQRVDCTELTANVLRSTRDNFANQWKHPTHSQSRRENHAKSFHEGEPDWCTPIGTTKTLPPGIEAVEQIGQDGNGEQAVDADAHL